MRAVRSPPSDSASCARQRAAIVVTRATGDFRARSRPRNAFVVRPATGPRVGRQTDRFWNENTGRLADVVDVDHVPDTRDDTFRPNQILAIGGLPVALVDGDRARRIVDQVEQQLLTPLGLRSLAPGEPGYHARYQGDPAMRDPIYHQGTVWPWLMGPFVEAWMRVRGGTSAARHEARRRFVEPLFAHLDSAASATCRKSPMPSPHSLREAVRFRPGRSASCCGSIALCWPSHLV
jgi:hypothetical protein